MSAPARRRWLSVSRFRFVAGSPVRRFAHRPLPLTSDLSTSHFSPPVSRLQSSVSCILDSVFEIRDSRSHFPHDLSSVASSFAKATKDTSAEEDHSVPGVSHPTLTLTLTLTLVARIPTHLSLPLFKYLALICRVTRNLQVVSRNDRTPKDT